MFLECIVDALEITRKHLAEMSREELEKVCLGAILIAGQHPEDFDNDERDCVKAVALALDVIDAEM